MLLPLPLLLLTLLFKLMDDVDEALLLLLLDVTRKDDRVGLLLSFLVSLFEADLFGETMAESTC